jgi:signal transduction histidine kinase
MRTPGIHPRLFMAAFLLICTTTLILDVLGVRITREFMHKRFNDRIAFLAKYLALNSEVGVLIGDRQGLNVLALNLLGEEDVARVVILDDQGNQLVDQKREVPGPLSIVKTPVIFKRSRGENILFQDTQTPFGKYKQPGEDFIGEVHVSFTTYGIEQLIKEITSKFIWFSMGLAVLAGIVFYFISRPIVEEVKQLAVTARQVGRGDMEVRVRPGKIPETRSLALDFNAMLDSLVQSRDAFDRVNREMIKQKSLAEVGKFSLMVAHEVKNPLSIIKSSLDILKKDHHLSSKNTMVSYMEDEIRRLNQLIEDFLLFARPIKPTLRSVDLNSMLLSTVERFEIQQSKASGQIKLAVSSDVMDAKADRDLLTRALSNIIKNSYDAVGDSGWIEIRSFWRDNIWVVEVIDNGNGIEPHHLKKVFEPFFTTRSKGTGLGLAFAAQVVKVHGGDITAENREGGGSIFRVKLPVKQV